MEKILRLILVALIVGLFGVAIWSLSQTKPNSSNKYQKYDANKIVAAAADNGNIADHYRGNKNAKVVVVEYGDMECGGCGGASPKMDKLYKKYKDKVLFIFRNFQMGANEGHYFSREAARAVEAAGLQGKYWPMLAAMYAAQVDWAVEDQRARQDQYMKTFEKIAAGADKAKFIDDMTNNKNILKKLDFDYDLGRHRHMVRETPSFYINGKKVNLKEMKRSKDGFEQLMSAKLDAELTKK